MEERLKELQGEYAKASATEREIRAQLRNAVQTKHNIAGAIAILQEMIKAKE